ncbi:MAG: ABC transporter permease, partial [Acidobacteriota bacterium]|nr:ABC transporter permease [Acidobacteriota bacterium]
MRFELFVAARYLRARRRQAVVGIVTSISIAGVAAGVAALIIALAITNGMRRDLQDKLLGASSEVDLMRTAADGIRNWRPLVDRLLQVPHVTAASPGLYGQVLVSRGPHAGFALIKGIIPSEELTVSNLLNSISSGSAHELAPVDPAVGLQVPVPDDSLPQPAETAYPPLVMGRDLADQIGAQVGDTVLITSPQGELTPLGLAPKYQRFRVVGIFHSGFFQYDSAMAFMRLSDAQKLFSEPDLLSVVSFKVDDMERAPQIGTAIEQAAGKGFMTTNWIEQNRPLFRALKEEQVVTFIIIALIVI